MAWPSRTPYPFYLPAVITDLLWRQASAKSMTGRRRASERSGAALVSVKPTRRGSHSWLEHVEKSPVRSPHKYARPGRTTWASRVYPWNIIVYTRTQERAREQAASHLARTCTEKRTETRMGDRVGKRCQWTPALSRARFLFPSSSLRRVSILGRTPQCRNREK